MKCRTYHRNPSIASAVIVPILPYAVLGAVVYFYGRDLLNLFGANSVIPDTKQLRSSVKTVSTASKSDIFNALTGNLFQTKYTNTPAVQAKKLADIKAQITKPTSAQAVAAKAKAIANDTKTVVEFVDEEAEAATASVKTAAKKAVVAAKKQGAAITTGITVIKSADFSDITGAISLRFSSLFGGSIEPGPGDAQAKQRAALAKIKTERGFK